MKRAGIVTVASSAIESRLSPFPGALLFQTTTATAPAAIAFCALTRNVQVPRWTRAIFPRTLAAFVKGVHPFVGLDATRPPARFAAGICGEEPVCALSPAMFDGASTRSPPYSPMELA